MRALDQSDIMKRHKGKWVALKSDRKTVVASGKSLQAVLKAAQKKGFSEPIVTRFPRTQQHFVGMHTQA